VYARGLESLTREQTRAARLAAEWGEERMVEFLVQSVYGTEPGNKYVRTENALESLAGYLSSAGGGDWIVTLESTAPYAAQIEQGNQLDYFAQQGHPTGFVPQVSLDELARLLDSIAESGMGANVDPDVFFDRTGQRYQEPGPHVTPAAIAAAYHFARNVEAAWVRFSRQ
jgi:hypothetical protein